eukprot:1237757-Alexandrium_andersonii.AAC.1
MPALAVELGAAASRAQRMLEHLAVWLRRSDVRRAGGAAPVLEAARRLRKWLPPRAQAQPNRGGFFTEASRGS